jgi:hypothetical protein
MMRGFGANIRFPRGAGTVMSMVAWGSLSWFVNLAANPGPRSGPHIFMAELLPLPAWGLMAGLIFAGAVLSDHPRLPWLRVQYVLAYAAFFYGCVGGFFLASGASSTGWGIYLSIAAMCFATSHHNWHIR